MLPIGHISLGDRPVGKSRNSNFTWPEHYTLLTLWSIARSPLFIGGDLPTTSDSTLFFLTNPEVIYVNQHSKNGHQIYHGWNDDTIIWIAEDENSDDIFFALFNTDEKTNEITFDFELEHLRGNYRIRDLWLHKDLGEFRKSFSKILKSHGASLFKMEIVE